MTNSVRNTGSVFAAATNTKYYLFSTVDGSRQDLKGTQAVPQLNAGQTFSLQVSVEIRADETLPGTYKVQACADGGKVVINLTTGHEDADLVTVAFLTATAAQTAGKRVIMFLTKEAVRLGLPGYADAIESAGAPPVEHPQSSAQRPTPWAHDQALSRTRTSALGRLRRSQAATLVTSRPRPGASTARA